MNINLKVISLVLIEAVSLAGYSYGAMAGPPQGALYYLQDLSVSLNAQNAQAMRFFQEGNSHMKERRYSAAVEAFKGAIKWGKNFSEAYANLSTAYLNLARYEDAAEAQMRLT